MVGKALLAVVLKACYTSVNERGQLSNTRFVETGWSINFLQAACTLHFSVPNLKLSSIW